MSAKSGKWRSDRYEAGVWGVGVQLMLCAVWCVVCAQHREYEAALKASVPASPVKPNPKLTPKPASAKAPAQSPASSAALSAGAGAASRRARPTPPPSASAQPDSEAAPDAQAEAEAEAEAEAAQSRAQIERNRLFESHLNESKAFEELWRQKLASLKSQQRREFRWCVRELCRAEFGESGVAAQQTVLRARARPSAAADGFAASVSASASALSAPTSASASASAASLEGAAPASVDGRKAGAGAGVVASPAKAGAAGTGTASGAVGAGSGAGGSGSGSDGGAERRDPCIEVLGRAVWIGAQKKSAFVMRLGVGDVRDVCQCPFGSGEDSEALGSAVYAARARHNRRLYAEGGALSALLLPGQTPDVLSAAGGGATGDAVIGGVGSSVRCQEWVRCAERTTEFHFPGIQQQISEAAAALYAVAHR
jgi:hypothetical protein